LPKPRELPEITFKSNLASEEMFATLYLMVDRLQQVRRMDRLYSSTEDGFSFNRFI